MHPGFPSASPESWRQVALPISFEDELDQRCFVLARDHHALRAIILYDSRNTPLGAGSSMAASSGQDSRRIRDAERFSLPREEEFEALVQISDTNGLLREHHRPEDDFMRSAVLLVWLTQAPFTAPAVPDDCLVPVPFSRYGSWHVHIIKYYRFHDSEDHLVNGLPHYRRVVMYVDAILKQIRDTIGTVQEAAAFVQEAVQNKDPVRDEVM